MNTKITLLLILAIAANNAEGYTTQSLTECLCNAEDALVNAQKDSLDFTKKQKLEESEYWLKRGATLLEMIACIECQKKDNSIEKILECQKEKMNRLVSLKVDENSIEMKAT